VFQNRADVNSLQALIAYNFCSKKALIFVSQLSNPLKTKIICNCLQCLSRNIFGKSLALSQIFEYMHKNVKNGLSDLKYIYISAHPQSSLGGFLQYHLFSFAP
jgi:hypothetical protein